MNPTPAEGKTHGVRIYRSNEGETNGSSSSDGSVALVSDARLPPARQLPPGGTKVGRISQHTKSLVEDVSAWVELKLKLTQIEIEERIDARLNRIATNAIAGVFAALGGLFLLVTLALGIAAILIALDVSAPLSYVVGFAAVALILLIVAAVMRRSKPDLVSVGDKKAHMEDSKLTPTLPPARTANAST